MLIAAVAKAMENLEVADFALQNKTPFIQEIDRPITPIKAEKKSVFRTFFISIFIGTFMAILFLVIRKIVKSALL